MKKLDKSIREIWEDKYVVPLYQRNFAWTEREINLLLQDIYDSFRKAPDSNYYIGSLIVLRRQDGTLEVIDGQQRLTTMVLLFRAFHARYEKVKDDLSASARKNIEQCVWKTDEYDKPDMNSLKLD